MGLLHDAGLADFYLQDIHGLNPLLIAMSQRGMPLDQATREGAAKALEVERHAVLAEINQLIPLECCPKKVYKKRPQRTCPWCGEACAQLWCGQCERALLYEPNLAVTQIAVTMTHCAYCAARRPNKKHTCWKNKPVQIVSCHETQEVYIKRLPFVLSPKGLLTYLAFKGYTTPKKYDRATGEKRATTDEAALLRLALTHEADPIFHLVLTYRDYEKQLSTYVGRPE